MKSCSETLSLTEQRHVLYLIRENQPICGKSHGQTTRSLSHPHWCAGRTSVRTELLTAPFLYLCARVHLCICVCIRMRTHTLTERSGLLNGSTVCVINWEETTQMGGREGLKHCGLFLCWLIEVTILMSVTSSCHDKPLWVKPVLSLAGSLLLLRCSYSTSPSLPIQGANLTTFMCDGGDLSTESTGVSASYHTVNCTYTLQRGKEMKRQQKQEDKRGKSLWPFSCLACEPPGLEETSAWPAHDGPASAGGIWLGSCKKQGKRNETKGNVFHRLTEE